MDGNRLVGKLSERFFWALGLWAGAACAGLSGQVRLSSGEGLPGVSIALQGRTELSTTSGAQGRWSLGSSSLHPRRGRMLPTGNLAWREGRLSVSFGSHSVDGKCLTARSGPGPMGLAAREAAIADTLVFSLCATKLRLAVGTLDSAGIEVVLDTTGGLRGCDAAQPSIPTLGFPTSWGDVTTYGGVDTSLTSAAGACNYGVTGIRFYAAIQVNLANGDGAGQWKEGRACGQGARVRAYTPQGVRETYVRIMDKCPDPHCGIDLGGAPAAAIMGLQAGRYQGDWTFVSAKGHPELSDGPTHLWTKEGSSAFWSLVQVRNPWNAVASLGWRAVSDSGSWQDMPWATEAENFFKVPTALLSATDSVDLVVRYVDSTRQSVRLAPADLAKPRGVIVLP